MNRLTLHPVFTIAPVDPRIFGGFLEHMGRCVYGGLYDPDSPQAGTDGLRRDVVAALRELRYTTVRYPGGNFASGYHWRDGVGRERPVRQELGWRSIEPNTFGTHEFMAACRALDWTPMLTVNLGTGTPEEARDWVEYCNRPTGTALTDERAANGDPAPFKVPLWCLGNELDGPWQMGAVPARDYAWRAQQAAKLMKRTDPEIELIACGTCSQGLPTYLDWDQTVLEVLGEHLDYLSIHKFAVRNRALELGTPEATRDILSLPLGLEQFVRAVDATCRRVAAKQKRDEPVRLCVDEYNVWYRTLNAESQDGRWTQAPPLLEEVYSLEDALVIAGYLNVFIRHADCVKLANLAQMVNVLGPLQTRGDALLKQALFYVLRAYAQRRTGIALDGRLQGGTFDGSYGPAPRIDFSAILDGERLHVFLVNRSLDSTETLVLDTPGLPVRGLVSAELLTADHPSDCNSFEAPERVLPRDFDAVEIVDAQATLRLPPVSFVACTLQVEPA